MTKQDLNILNTKDATVTFKAIGTSTDETLSWLQRVWLCLLVGNTSFQRSINTTDTSTENLYDFIKGSNQPSDAAITATVELLLANAKNYLSAEDKTRLKSTTVSTTDGVVTLSITTEAGTTSLATNTYEL